MSLDPSSATCLSSAIRRNSPQRESFKKFFECWLSEQNSHLQELTSLAKSPSSATDEAALGSLIERVVGHYESYYCAKGTWSRHYVRPLARGPWEALRVDTSSDNIKRGLGRHLPRAAILQLSQVDALQRRTRKEEKEISEEMANHQETLAGPDTVELSHIVSEQLMAHSSGINNDNEEEEEERVETALKPKEKGLEEVSKRADELRTLKGVIELLTPIQAVHFLIAATELHLNIHEWGMKRDAKHNRHGD